MLFLPEILIFCFFIFLYVVFSFAHDDFLLLRRNVSIEQLFNMSFVGFLIGLFFARLVFVIENFSPAYFHPLVFLLFPYFPGLSFVGSIIGAVSYIGYTTQKKKIPFARIVDIFSVSFFISVTVGKILLTAITMLMTKKISPIIGGQSAAFILCSLFLALLLVKGKLKDGQNALLTGIFFSLILLGTKVIATWKKFAFGLEDLLMLVLFFMTFLLFISQQFFSTKLSKK